MEKLKLFLQNKKEKSNKQLPKYGMRKLSVGLVSCFLGCAIFMTPSVVNAESEMPAEDKTLVADTSKNETTETPALENLENAEVENVAQDKKVQELEEIKDENITDKEAEDKEVEEAQHIQKNEAVTEEDNLKNSVETEEESKQKEVLAEEEILEIADQVEPASLKESEAEASPISAETGVIKNVEISIGGADNGDKTTTVNPTASADRIDGKDTDLNLKTRIDFDIPEGTRSGSTFDILISDNVNFHGIVKDQKVKAIEYNGDEIATGVKLEGEKRGYRYTFNDTVNDLTDIRVRLEYPLFIDPKAVPGDSPKETVKVSLTDGDGTVIGENSKDFKVEYEKGVYEVDEEAHTITVSGSANIVDVTNDTYKHIIYVNPTGDQGLTGSHVEIKNQEYKNEEGKKVAYDGAIFDEEVKDSVKVYKIKDKEKDFNLSYDLVESNLEDVTAKANVEIVEDLWGGPSYLKVDVNQENHDDSVYVVTYTGKRKPNQATKTNVWFTAESRQMEGYDTTRVTDTNGGWHWTNEILFDDPETIAKAEGAHNLGDRVWIDANKNGIQDDDEVGLKDVKVTLKGDDILPVTIKTDENGNYKFKKLKDGTYTVEFTVPDGYEPTTAKAEGSTDVNNSDASLADGATVATATGTIQSADNMNVDFGVIKSEVKKGSFKETHVYITKDFDGNVLEDKTITEAGKSSEGTKDKTYDSSKVDKAGYELVKVTADKGSDEVTISEDGKSVEAGNYVEDKELAVTYEYVKQPGRFVEHHIYQTVDKDGNVVTTDDTVDVTEKDGKKIEGFSNESVSTDKKDKDGYSFKEATGIKLENDESEETYTNYVPGKTLEKTYVYVKTEEEQPVEEKGSFQEHHIYITKDQDGKETSRKTEDGELQEGKKEESYTTSKKEKDGFTLVRTENPVEEPKFNEDGTETTGNYKPGKKQEITYVYEKTVNDPKPEPVKPENPVDPETDETPDEPNTSETPEKPERNNPGKSSITIPNEVKKSEIEKEEKSETKEVDEPKTVEVEKEDTKTTETVEEKDTQISEESLSKKSSTPDYKAPQTFDPGMASYLGLGSMASTMLAYVEYKRRKRK